MYIPDYKLTDRLVNSLVKLEVDRAGISSQSTPAHVRAKMEKRSKVLNLFHIGHMMGVTMTLKDAERLAEGKKFEFGDNKGIILNNFRNILEFNRSSVADGYSVIDVNLVSHLNKIMLTGWKEIWEVKLRTGGERISDLTTDDWVELRDQDMPANSLQTELSDILEWFNATEDRVYVLIRIAVLLYRFWEISPYQAGNKLTLIALADFLLNKYGYSNKAFIPSVRSFDMDNEKYIEARAFARERNDIGVWVELLIRGLAADVEEIKDEYYKLVGEQEKATKQPFLDLNKRQLKILRYLQTIPTVQREDYCQMMDVSTMTAFRDLNDLVKKKLLRVDGQGRATKYMLYNR